MSDVRTRFAPSPTGALHLGNLRVAAFNHLFSRHHGGRFVLRVEDTDVERNVEGALEAILDDLRWAGLDWDEGPDVGGPFAPYRQSERGDLHRDAAGRLHERGLAYLCFCSDDDVEAARARERDTPRCPGACRDLPPGEVEARRDRGDPAALRFEVPTGITSVTDEVRGEISFPDKDIGDFILLRADGRATYNFAVVVDDVAMEITHVIRGAGHLSNTPKQALLFDALEAPRPAFAHLPMVLDKDRRKLSKRAGAEGLARLRAEGFHPDGVVNYLSLLGWSAGEDREVLSRRELAEAMDLARVGVADTVFDPEKLRWVSAQHIARMPLHSLVETLDGWIDRERFRLKDDEVTAAVAAIRTRLTTFGEVNAHLALLFPEPETLRRGRGALAGEEGAAEVLQSVLARLSGLAPQEWDPEALSRTVREAGKEAGVRGRGLFHPVRLALIGSREGPDLGLTLAGVGQQRSLDRLKTALEALARG
jgi:glutamyl-tRNA synthetase